MTPKDSDQTIIVSHNYWRIPSVERAFSGWLEGQPTEQERRETIQAAIDARKNWKPSQEALQLVEELKVFTGCKVRVQLWDTSMWYHELEGSFPFDAMCGGVDVRQEGEFPQAYLMLNEIAEVPNDYGYSPEPYFQKTDGCDYYLASLADLYSITKIASTI